MNQGNHNPTEAAHIGEELFDDADYESERQCRSAHHAISRDLLNREKALKVYKVSIDQYASFLAKTPMI